MRDPKRIDKMLELLRGVWHMYPDMRFGQLIQNIVPETVDALFFVPDDEMTEYLDKVLRTGL